MQKITSQLTEPEKDEFMTIGYTIGGMMIFPANRINGMQTINGARGFNRTIADRLDLTLECIRRHYLGQANPLDETLARYTDFFELFNDIRGYVDFFLLQDLMTDDYLSVRFFMPFDNFKPQLFHRTSTSTESFNVDPSTSSGHETSGSAIAHKNPDPLQGAGAISVWS
jgi:hypothetical protein